MTDGANTTLGVWFSIKLRYLLGMFNFKNCFGANPECDVIGHNWLIQTPPNSTQTAQATPVVLYQRIQQIQQEQKGNKSNQ